MMDIAHRFAEVSRGRGAQAGGAEVYRSNIEMLLTLIGSGSSVRFSVAYPASEETGGVQFAVEHVLPGIVRLYLYELGRALQYSMNHKVVIDQGEKTYVILNPARNASPADRPAYAWPESDGIVRHYNGTDQDFIRHMMHVMPDSILTERYPDRESLSLFVSAYTDRKKMTLYYTSLRIPPVTLESLWEYHAKGGMQLTDSMFTVNVFFVFDVPHSHQDHSNPLLLVNHHRNGIYVIADGQLITLQNNREQFL